MMSRVSTDLKMMVRMVDVLMRLCSGLCFRHIDRIASWTLTLMMGRFVLCRTGRYLTVYVGSG